MSLAIFDLDNTLLSGDSDYLWGCFLVENGLVDREYYEKENKRFYEQYKAGNLDIYEFVKFAFRPLAENSLEDLLQLQIRFMMEKIRPIMSSASIRLVEKHRQAGDTLMIITATNRFVTAPIAAAFGIPHLLATEPEVIENQFTGELAGVPCFREGKITRLNQWLEQYNETLHDSWFYSDSHNDLPLLSCVTRPVVVDPDEKLARHAQERRWPVISLKVKE